MTGIPIGIAGEQGVDAIRCRLQSLPQAEAWSEEAFRRSILFQEAWRLREEIQQMRKERKRNIEESNFPKWALLISHFLLILSVTFVLNHGPPLASLHLTSLQEAYEDLKSRLLEAASGDWATSASSTVTGCKNAGAIPPPTSRNH